MIIHSVVPHNLGVSAVKALLFSHGDPPESFTWNWNGEKNTFRFVDDVSFLGFSIHTAGFIVVEENQLRGELTLPDMLFPRITKAIAEGEFRKRLQAILKG